MKDNRLTQFLRTAEDWIGLVIVFTANYNEGASKNRKAAESGLPFTWSGGAVALAAVVETWFDCH